MKLRKILDWRETLRNSGLRHLRATALLLFLMTGIAWCLAVADRNPIHLIEDISEYYGAEDDLFNQSFNEYIDGIVNGTNDTPLGSRPASVSPRRATTATSFASAMPRAPRSRASAPHRERPSPRAALARSSETAERRFACGGR